MYAFQENTCIQRDRSIELNFCDPHHHYNLQNDLAFICLFIFTMNKDIIHAS